LLEVIGLVTAAAAGVLALILPGICRLEAQLEQERQTCARLREFLRTVSICPFGLGALGCPLNTKPEEKKTDFPVPSEIQKEVLS